MVSNSSGLVVIDSGVLFGLGIVGGGDGGIEATVGVVGTIACGKMDVRPGVGTTEELAIGSVTSGEIGGGFGEFDATRGTN